jgi:dihydroorotate dehydrogenase (NAD+) catalytic subunit
MDVTIAPRTGLRLKNPVMTASGTFGYGTEFAARMDISELGAVVCKGTTREPRAGNPPVRVAETAAGMVNAIGLQNIGVEAVVREKAPIWATWPVPVLVNVSGTSVEDYCFIVSRLDGVPGVAGVELNVSCPNVKEGGVAFGTDRRLVREVTAAVRQVTRLPLIVKLSPNVTDIRPIASAAEEAGADAVSLVNTLYGVAIDARRRRPVLSTVSGGLSGPAIKPYALYLVFQTAQVVTAPVIGLGGIRTAQDALEFMLAGATAVQVGTALMVDPTAWRGIVSGVAAWCEREGVRSLAEIVGAANDGFRGVGSYKRAGEAHLAGSS